MASIPVRSFIRRVFILQCGVVVSCLSMTVAAGMAKAQPSPGQNNWTARILSLQATVGSGSNVEAISQANALLQEMAAEQLSLSDPALLQVHLQLGFALRNAQQVPAAEVQFRYIVRYAPESNTLDTLRDADLEISKIASIDGRLAESRAAILGALSIQRQRPQQDGMLPLILTQAGAVENLTENRDRALDYLLEARGLLKDDTDVTKNPVRILLLNTLIGTYRQLGDEARIVPLVEEMRQAASTADGLRLYTQIHNQLEEDKRLRDGDFPGAIQIAMTAAEDSRTLPGGLTPLTAASVLSNVASLRNKVGDDPTSEAAYKAAVGAYQKLFADQFLTMTEYEKHQLLAAASPIFQEFYSFCLLHQTPGNNLADSAYRLALWEKSVISDSLRIGRAGTAKIGDQEFDNLVQNMHQSQAHLEQILRTRQVSAELNRVQQELDDSERKVAARLTTNGFHSSATLEQLRKALPESDAAAEVISFQLTDQAGPTYRTIYVAVILKSGPQHPAVMINLGDALDIELSQKSLQNRAANQFPSLIPADGQETFSSLPWRKMEQTLKGARRIYLAPSGVLDTTAFLAWQHSDKRYLIEHDEIDLRPVFSTAELIDALNQAPPKSAFLIGNPDFDANEADNHPRTEVSPVDPAAMRTAVGLRFEQLPPTAGELKSVFATLKKAGIRTDPPLEQARATKSALLEVRHPAILHIATHGFFFPMDDIGADMDPVGLALSLQRSGLALAGANKTLAQPNGSAQTADGLVTALDVSMLDLHGTQLVTLSACETGLGQRSTSGEVLGLRRSFHIAGAERVMVSMWAVNTDAAAKLMTAFYANWIGQGEDPYIALRQAAKEIRKQHPEPYYWAPFVLYGP